MPLIVMKFGSASVRDTERIKNAASKVAAEVKRGNKVVVVVSAMAGVTEQLEGYCRSVTPRHDLREHDVVIATGEQISSGLMAIALQQRGLMAHSWMGWQIPIRTNAVFNNAEILNIDPKNLLESVNNGEIAVVAGFQGVAPDGSMTTLGRGSADLTAVAIAGALQADRCDLYCQIDGIYTADPAVVETAVPLEHITFQEILELASLKAGAIKLYAIERAYRQNTPLQVLSFTGNSIGSDKTGTLVTKDEQPMATSKHVTGIAFSLDFGEITVKDLRNEPGLAAMIFNSLGQSGIDVDMIIQSNTTNSPTTTVTFTTKRTDVDRAVKVLEAERDHIDFGSINVNKKIAKLSLVGIGMRRVPGIAAKMFETLGTKKINIRAIETSEITISVLIEADYAELAVRALHTAFGLDKK